MRPKRVSLSVSSLAIAAVVVFGGAATAAVSTAANALASGPTSSSLGTYSPTFVGSAAQGCTSPHCSLLTGPFATGSTESLPASGSAANALAGRANSTPTEHAMPSPRIPRNGPDPTPPTVICQPVGVGCDSISSNSGGATGVKGINAVDSGSLSTNLAAGDVEPADQALCAGNGYVVEGNNIGEILVFNTALGRLSPVIPLDTVMGLTSRGWSSGGDPSCLYDSSNGGHWFFTEIVSASTEASGGPFSGCFAAAKDGCYEGIAVTQGSSPFGPYNVYFLNANYNPREPGYPYLLNDFAKISVTRDAFLLFYDEFPLNSHHPGFGGGFFNGAQEFAFSKNAMEAGLPVTDPGFNVAVENMGLIPTPNGNCGSTDNPFGAAGVTCWYAVIPAQPPDPSQYDNSHGGSGFMVGTLDYFGSGDSRIAVFDWTGLSNLASENCASCAGIQFGGQLFSNVLFYYGEGFLAAQKAGPIPLGSECGAAGLSTSVSCPEGGIATNGDFMTQVAQAQGELWGATTTEVTQTYGSGSTPEIHQGAVYWVVGTSSFDTSGQFTLTSQGYVAAAHEDLEFPTIAASDTASKGSHGASAIMSFTLSGNGGPTGADNGGFYPSSAFGRLTSTSGGLVGSVINIADLGQAPQDGFTEYLSGGSRPRWGDYGAAVYLAGTNRIYFAGQYIQYPNCTGQSFSLTVGTCGGTRDGYANWGTSVNYVVP